MTHDARTFRKALGSFATGIVVVTAPDLDDPAGPARGITVNSFSSVSLEPPLVLWCLGNHSGRYDLFTKPANFTISILDAGQKAISDRLAGSAECSVAGLDLSETENGVPGLADSLAVFECTREAIHQAGDHAIIIGRVTRFGFREGGAPLLYYRGAYGALASSS
jgi:Conserved protein/domain typically associated with flavoprotein oxygenases, DIM6/NTAB family